MEGECVGYLRAYLCARWICRCAVQARFYGRLSSRWTVHVTKHCTVFLGLHAFITLQFVVCFALHMTSSWLTSLELKPEYFKASDEDLL